MNRLLFLIFLIQFSSIPFLVAQNTKLTAKTKSEFLALIDSYSEARDKKDTVLLREILTDEVDQLVSSGEWREGISEAVEGMQRSSNTNVGKRSLTVEKSRLLLPEVGIIDARYQIESQDGSIRNMWSTFVVIKEDGRWKISAIRNMLPSTQ
jgi:ketosteroid isomerase-like protein